MRLLAKVVLVMGLTGCSYNVWAQVLDVTACEVANHPSKYDGKVVRIKGLVQVGFDSFAIRGTSCNQGVWLSYPEGTKGKAGPTVLVTMQLASNAPGTAGKSRPAVVLERNKDFETFDTLLSTKVKTPGMCLGCVKNDVMATLVGRIDGTDNPGLTKGSDGKITGLDGFGNLNAYMARMVLQSVSDVTAQEIDYSKVPKVKDDSQGGGGKDYLGTAKKSEDAFPKGSDAVKQLQRTLDAFGGPGVDNGVVVSFGGTAEVPAGEGTKNAKSSPDGLILTVDLDSGLKGDALSRVIVFAGEEVADAREGVTNSYFVAEQKALNAMLVETIGARQKSLTVDGGTALWSEDWPAADRSANAGNAASSYLSDRVQAPK